MVADALMKAEGIPIFQPLPKGADLRAARYFVAKLS